MARIVVIGANPVGITLADALKDAGHEVSFVDSDEQRAGLLNRPVQYDTVPYGGMVLVGVDVVFMVLPTPTKEGGADFDALVRVTQLVGAALFIQCSIRDLGAWPAVVYHATRELTQDVQAQLGLQLAEASGVTGAQLRVAFAPLADSALQALSASWQNKGVVQAVTTANALLRRVNEATPTN